MFFSTHLQPSRFFQSQYTDMRCTYPVETSLHITKNFTTFAPVTEIPLWRELITPTISGSLTQSALTARLAEQGKDNRELQTSDLRVDQLTASFEFKVSQRFRAGFMPDIVRHKEEKDNKDKTNTESGSIPSNPGSTQSGGTQSGGTQTGSNSGSGDNSSPGAFA